MKLEEVKEDLSKGVSLDLVLIPAGKFVMGASESEKEKYGLNDERDGAKTQHEVTMMCRRR